MGCRHLSNHSDALGSILASVDVSPIVPCGFHGNTGSAALHEVFRHSLMAVVIGLFVNDDPIVEFSITGWIACLIATRAVSSFGSILGVPKLESWFHYFDVFTTATALAGLGVAGWDLDEGDLLRHG